MDELVIEAAPLERLRVRCRIKSVKSSCGHVLRKCKRHSPQLRGGRGFVDAMKKRTWLNPARSLVGRESSIISIFCDSVYFPQTVHKGFTRPRTAKMCRSALRHGIPFGRTLVAMSRNDGSIPPGRQNSGARLQVPTIHPVPLK